MEYFSLISGYDINGSDSVSTSLKSFHIEMSEYSSGSANVNFFLSTKINFSKLIYRLYFIAELVWICCHMLFSCFVFLHAKYNMR